MTIYNCPKGHQSTEPDYCSECGAKIIGANGVISTSTISPNLSQTVSQAVSQEISQVSQTTKSAIICPDCSAPHEADSGNFCEICGYNFTTRTHGEVPISPISPTLETQKTEQETNICPTSSPVTAWEIIITIDPNLRHPESPEAPINQPPITYPLNKPVNLIGRNSKAKAVYPEIALDFDDAVSHRHAVLNQQADGTFTLRDIGSANGTLFRGIELKPMVDTPLKEGDTFTLGHWTKITLKAIH
jgi:FHA domain